MNFIAFSKELAALAAMSNKYGANPAYVLAGGGNTSFKNDKNLWIKGSGTSLATIRAEEFVAMDRTKLNDMWSVAYPGDESAREAAVLKDMMDARMEGETRRPSVETLLHDLFPQRYILHVHPALVNGLTCSLEAETAMKRLFPDGVWVAPCKPGYILALECKKVMEAYKAQNGKDCDLVFLQNHGIFFAADSIEGLDALAERVMGALSAAIRRQPELDAVCADEAKVDAVSQQLKALYGEDSYVCFLANKEILNYDPATKSLSPDHIVYAKAKQLAVCDKCNLAEAFAAFEAENGYKPKIIFFKGLGMFACGMSQNEAKTAATVMLDAIQVVAYAESFGGVSPMPDLLIDFIIHWEVESYRAKVSLSK